MSTAQIRRLICSYDHAPAKKEGASLVGSHNIDEDFAGAINNPHILIHSIVWDNGKVNQDNRNTQLRLRAMVREALGVPQPSTTDESTSTTPSLPNVLPLSVINHVTMLATTPPTPIDVQYLRISKRQTIARFTLGDMTLNITITDGVGTGYPGVVKGDVLA